jgi:hypothetical protein
MRKYVHRKPHASRKYMLAYGIVREQGFSNRRPLSHDKLYALMTVLGYAWSVKRQQWQLGEPLVEVQHTPDNT